MHKAGAFKAIVLVAMLAYAGIMGIAAQQTAPGNDSSSAQTSAIGPFGFHIGESEAEVIAQVGSDALINKGTPTQLFLTTAPKPHPEFDHYFLFFQSSKGLLRIAALGREIKSGSELRAHFSALQEALVKIYGKPSKENHLSCTWTNPPNAAHIKVVVLDVSRSRDSSALRIEYQFEGYAESLNADKARNNSVL